MYENLSDVRKMVSEGRSDIDFDLALSYMGNNKTLLKQIIGFFVSMDKDLPDRILNYYEQKDYISLHRTIHDVKGISLNLGSRILYSYSDYLCKLLVEKKEAPDFEEINLYAKFCKNVITRLERSNNDK